MSTTAPQATTASPNATSAASAASLCAAFQSTVAAHGGRIALRTPDGAIELTYSGYGERVRRIAAGLAALGLRRGDTVGLLLTNRPEFHLVDTAALHLGATPYSIYATSSPEQIAYLLDNADNDVLVVEPAFLERAQAACAGRERPHHIVVVGGEGTQPPPAAGKGGTITLPELESSGAEDFDFEAEWRAVEPGDVATLIYTSGTTGPPKGVELTHANLLAQCRSVAEVLSIEPGDTITSYLPSAHIADRWSSHYNGIVFGIEITCVPDPRQVAAVLPQLRPTLWGAVPRVVEKLKAALEAGLQAEPDEARRTAVLEAIDVAKKKVRLEQAGEPIPEDLVKTVAQLDDAILSKLRAKIGLDRAKWVIIGAAPLSRDVQEFLLALGLPVTEIYGMSECSCCVTMTGPDQARIGSVGQALSCVELSLADDGELLVRGETIMRGYRRQPEKTAGAIDAEGWLHTGDICTIDDDGYVRIVDRKKELIINAAGKNMSPANIEGQLKSASPLIGQAAVIGDARPYNVALLVLDPDIAAATATKLGLEDKSVAAVASHERVQAQIAAAVEAANAKLSRVEQIKRYELLADEWLPGGEELTPTMKLKRKPIAEKYAGTIDRLYTAEA